MKTIISFKMMIMSILFMMTSCQGDYPIAREKYYAPNTCKSDNFHGKVKSCEQIYYPRTIKSEEVVVNGKIKDVNNWLSKKVLVYNQAGIRIYKELYYNITKDSNLFEWDEFGRIINYNSDRTHKYIKINKRKVKEIITYNNGNVYNETIFLDRYNLPYKILGYTNKVEECWKKEKINNRTLEVHEFYEEDSKNIYCKEFYYQGNLIKEINYDSYVLKNEYKNGEIVTTKKERDSGVTIVITKSAEREVREEYDKNGKLVDRSIWKFNSNGDVIQRTFSFMDEIIIVEYEYIYDSKNNWVVKLEIMEGANSDREIHDIYFRRIEYYDDYSNASNYIDKVKNQYIVNNTYNRYYHYDNSYQNSYNSYNKAYEYYDNSNKRLVSKEIRYKETCPDCKGSGTIINNTYPPTFGLNPPDQWCSICGRYYAASIGHSHITCRTCNGSKTITKVRYVNAYE